MDYPLKIQKSVIENSISDHIGTITNSKNGFVLGMNKELNNNHDENE
jgi:hypothetical protein